MTVFYQPTFTQQETTMDTDLRTAAQRVLEMAVQHFSYHRTVYIGSAYEQYNVSLPQEESEKWQHALEALRAALAAPAEPAKREGNTAAQAHGGVCATHGQAVLVCHINDGTSCDDYLTPTLKQAAPAAAPSCEVVHAWLEVRKQEAIARADWQRAADWRGAQFRVEQEIDGLRASSPAPTEPPCYPHDWETVGVQHIKCRLCGAQIQKVATQPTEPS